jgi:peptidoglycan hydrolase-like protein with peptidoglycan-binding domain
MERIFNFSDFSALYENQSAAEVYGQNLKIVVAELLGLYFDMTKYGEYTDQEMDSDFQSIVAGNSLGDKIEAFKKIIEKAKTKSLADNKIEAAKDLIEMTNTAYNKFLEALDYIAKKYADNPTDKPEVKTEKEEDSKSLIELLNKEVEDFKTNLKEQEQANENESNSIFSGYSQIFEGNKSLLSDAENIISSLRGKIDSYKTDEDPRKKKFATDADLEIVKISNLIKGLREKKNREIEKSEIKKILNDLKTLENKFDNGINKIIDENTTDAELERLRNKARDSKDQISPLKNEYLKAKSAAEEKEKSEKVKVKLETDYIDYVPEESNTSNPEVKKFQELVVDAFKNIKSVTDLPFYKKMGTSGKYGPNTRDMVKFLKRGFKLNDKSGDITKELVDEIQIQRGTIKESISSRIYDFSSFVNISEAAFDLSAGLEFAKTLPTYKSGKTTGKTASKEDEKSPYGWKPASYKEGSTGSIVKAIQNILGVGDSSSGTFDKQTTDRVIEFQKLNDLEDDGIVGKKTLEAIYGTRDSAKTHKLLDKTRRGPWSYETIGKEISQVYSKPAGATGTESAKKEKDPLSSWKENENAWKKIKSGYGDLGTNTEDLEDGIKMINSIESLRFIDSIFSKGIPYKPKDISGKEEDTIKYNKSRSAVPDGYSSLSNMLDNELGLGNAETAKNIKKHLETIPGVKVEYKLVPGSSDVDYIKISY